MLLKFEGRNNVFSAENETWSSDSKVNDIWFFGVNEQQRAEGKESKNHRHEHWRLSHVNWHDRNIYTATPKYREGTTLNNLILPSNLQN